MEEIRGMAPTPEVMEKIRQVQSTQPKEPKKKKVRASVRTVTMRSDAPPFQQEIVQIMYGLHWQYNKRVLDLIRVAVPEKKWDITRTLVMDVQTEHIDNLRTLVVQRITELLSKEKKDNGTENGASNGK